MIYDNMTVPDDVRDKHHQVHRENYENDFRVIIHNAGRIAREYSTHVVYDDTKNYSVVKGDTTYYVFSSKTKRVAKNSRILSYYNDDHYVSIIRRTVSELPTR